MKSLPIASLALVLALSGCSSSPSIEEQDSAIEEQIKLLEYEKCLSYNEMLTSRLIDAAIKASVAPPLKDFEYEDILKACSKHRP